MSVHLARPLASPSGLRAMVLTLQAACVHIAVVWVLQAPLHAIGNERERDVKAECADRTDAVNWEAAKQEMWECVLKQTLTQEFASRMVAMQGRESRCLLGVATASAIIATHTGNLEDYVNPFQLRAPLRELLSSGFPIFGALEWLSSKLGDTPTHQSCVDEATSQFRETLLYHLREGSAVPTLPTLEYVGAAAADSCEVGRAAGYIALAVNLASQAGGTTLSAGEISYLLDRADKLLWRAESTGDLATLARLGTEWAIWTLLHRLTLSLTPELRNSGASKEPAAHSSGCIIMVYAFPTAEIRSDTEKALKALETYYFDHVGVRYPLVVFTDEKTAPNLAAELGEFTSAPVVPAVMPADEMMRPMSSYSCVEGVHCVSGGARLTSAHRGNVNATQYWSPDYLRISRYTAGPLFMHPALDTCGAFIKVDTDFFLTAPIRQDPIAELRREGSRLAYWQIHVQGQRQAGYTEASLEFLGKRNLRIRNGAFYARGRFEERANKLGIDVSAVPEALEAATVVYGCLFGGDVRFFREPLYRDFFRHMDAKSGFETHGWSNQFFLGTSFAAFVFQSQVRRLYISGRHQESKIDIANGNVTEFLLGSLKSVLR